MKLKELLERKLNSLNSYYSTDYTDVKLAIQFLNDGIFPPKELSECSFDHISITYPLLYSAKYDPSTLTKDLMAEYPMLYQIKYSEENAKKKY